MNRSPYNDHHSGLERRMHCSVLAFPTDHKTESYGKICSTQAIVKEIQQNTKDVNYPSLCLPPYSPLSGNLARHSVQFSCSAVPNSLRPHELQHTRPPCLPGAGERHSTRDKGHEEGGSAYAKAGSSLGSAPGYSRASTPKTPESAYFIALCSHL